MPPLQLADFGFSKDANQHSAPTSRVGTPAYLAPEVVTNEPGEAHAVPGVVMLPRLHQPVVHALCGGVLAALAMPDQGATVAPAPFCRQELQCRGGGAAQVLQASYQWQSTGSTRSLTLMYQRSFAPRPIHALCRLHWKKHGKALVHAHAYA